VERGEDPWERIDGFVTFPYFVKSYGYLYRWIF